MMKKSTQQSKICPRKKCRLAAFERGSFFFFFYKKKYAKKKKKKQQKRLSRRRENVSKAAAYTKDSAHTLIFHVNARREPRSWKETERARSCPHSDTQPQTTNSGVLILQSLDLRFKNVSIAFETKVCTNIPVLLAQLLSQWRGNTPMTASFFFFFLQCAAAKRSQHRVPIFNIHFPVHKASGHSSTPFFTSHQSTTCSGQARQKGTHHGKHSKCALE